MIKELVFFIGFVVFSGFASAHGVGLEQEFSAEDYLFELAVDPPQIIAGLPVDLSLAVHNASTEAPLGIDNLWIKISRDGKIIFATDGFHTTNETILIINYVFAEAGNYQVDAAVLKSGKQVRATFGLVVEGEHQLEESSTVQKYVLASGVGAIVGLAAGMLILKKKK